MAKTRKMRKSRKSRKLKRSLRIRRQRGGGGGNGNGNGAPAPVGGAGGKSLAQLALEQYDIVPPPPLSPEEAAAAEAAYKAVEAAREKRVRNLAELADTETQRAKLEAEHTIRMKTLAQLLKQGAPPTGP